MATMAACCVTFCREAIATGSDLAPEVVETADHMLSLVQQFRRERDLLPARPSDAALPENVVPFPRRPAP
jgi:hypothetical protein